MILCKNCGKLKSYKIRQIVTNEFLFSDGDLPYAMNPISTKFGEPRCPKCGRTLYLRGTKEANEYWRLKLDTESEE